jgi:hypothetical protein
MEHEKVNVQALRSILRSIPYLQRAAFNALNRMEKLNFHFNYNYCRLYYFQKHMYILFSSYK